MKSKTAIILLSLFWGSHAFGQQTLFFAGGRLADSVLSTVPTRNVVNTATGIEVTYDFSSAVIMKDDLFPGHYLWKMDGFGLNGESGTPSTLLRIDRFGIPDGKVCRIEVVETRYKDFEYVLSPARPPLPNSGNETYTKDNVRPIDPAIAVFPEQIVEEEGIQKYRGRGILNVRVSPIQYHAATGKTRVFTRIKYAVSFAEKNGQARVSAAGDTLTHSVSVKDNFLSNILLTEPEEGRQKAGVSTRLNQQDYLIVSVPKYESAVRQFSEWKKLMGYNVHTIIKSEWTTATVKSEVRKFYDENSNFYFLLIVGDHEDVPAVYSSYGISNYVTTSLYITDLPYVCMDGDDDYVPDVYMGRLPVSTSSEATVVVNKIINYEKNPVTTASFYNTGVNCAYFQDDMFQYGYADNRFVQTAEEVRTYLLGQGKSVQRIYYAKTKTNPTNWNNSIYSNGEPIPEELRKPGFAWDGNATDITKAINAGAFYVLHRDHGLDTCWVEPHFDQSDIEKLSNGNKLPVVFSINCQTGQFNGRTCFAETFLRKPNGGCVAIYGATESSLSGENDVLTAGMFDAIWPDPGLRIVIPKKESGGKTPAPTYQLGQILHQGMERLFEVYGVKPRAIYTREIFHCFGDPSMRIHTDVPRAFSSVTVNRGSNNITVSLSNGEKATITFYNLMNGKVTSYEGSNVVYETKRPYCVTVCVSGHNRIPDIRQGMTPPDVYIQNETITGTKTYTGRIIKIGANVTDSKPQGPVVIKAGARVNLQGGDVQILPGTTVELGAEVNIIPQQ